MNILLITDLYPLFEGEEGIPLTIRDFALGFIQEGHSVCVLRPNFILNTIVRKRKTYKNGLYEDSGIKIFIKNFLFPFDKGGVLRAYKKYFKDEKFDIILAHMPSGIMTADIISKEYKIPMLCAVHSSDITVLTNIKYFMFKKRMVQAYKNAECILPRSFWLKDKIKKIIPDLNKPVEIIYSGVPLKLIKENEIHLGFSTVEEDTAKEPGKKSGRKFNPKKAKIITVSSLIKRKNIKTLISAYRKLKKKHPKISLEIIGDGILREKFEILNFKYKLDIKFLGKLSKDEVYKKMMEADIFVLPSKNETFGMVYMEALAHGNIVLCTQNSGVDGIIQNDKNGFLIKPNKKGVYDALKKILSFNSREFSEISKNAIATAKMFSYENSIKNYLQKIELFKL